MQGSMLLITGLVLLPTVASVRNLASKHLKHAVHVESMESIPMYMYKDDCWKKHPIVLTETTARVYKQIPGAGLNPDKIEPFAQVLKDGFFEAGCVKDYMFEHGDKYGANRHTYEVEQRSNVSIVHYKDVVPKEDQQSMTQQVCFEFCRTVPDMGSFGLIHGRDCYCTPWFQQMAGDSSDCDAVCEGNPTTMCGGMAKSSVFEMHLCADTANDLAAALEKAGNLGETMETQSGAALDASSMMQNVASNLQDQFGNAGDPTASNLMQSAKVFAGDLQHAAEDVEKIHEEISSHQSDGDGMEGGDFSDFETIQKAEACVDGLEKSVAAGEEATEALLVLSKLAGVKDMSKEGDEEDGKGSGSGEEEGEGDSNLKEFMPIMYFVDREFEKVPATCGGDGLNKPYLGTADECAKACSYEGTACAGFSFFTGKESLCFFFTKFKEVTYYTGCAGGPDSEEKSFLEVSKKKKEGDEDRVQCYAKFSSFSGTTLKPNPSGKCKMCLKSANKAQRCFEE